MNSLDRIRHSVLVDLLRRARIHLPTGPVCQQLLDEASSDHKDKLLLAVDIDTVFKALSDINLLPRTDRPTVEHPIESTDEDRTIL